MNLFRNARSITSSIFAACLVPALLTAAAAAQIEPKRPGGFGPQQGNDDLIKLRIVTDTATIQPGEMFHIVFLFDITKENWHLYWKNPGAGAAPIEINVSGPSGFVIEDVRWPRPKVIESNVGDMYAYEKQIALFVPVRAPYESMPEAGAFQYDVAWAVCDDKRCVMGQRRGMHTIVSGLPQGDESSDLQTTIRRHRSRLPVDADESSDVDVTVAGETLTVSGPAKGYKSAVFLPHPTPGVSFGEPEFTFEEGRFQLTVTISIKPRNFAGTKPQARGLIGLGENTDGPSVEFAVDLK